MARNLDYKADLLADLRDDLGYAGEYLSAAYSDSQEAFLVALRDVAEAQKGVARVAELAKVNRENLYRTLSKHGNPTLNTVGSVLDVLGLKMLIVPQEAEMPPLGNPDPSITISQSAAPTQKASNMSKLTATTVSGWTGLGLATANTSGFNIPFGVSIEPQGIDVVANASLQWSVVAQAQKSEQRLEAA